MTDNYVALLGTKGGPAIRTGSAMPTASLLCLEGRLVVVDCGLGVTRGLVDQGVALKDLSDIVVTHMHSDHFLELGPLLHTAWTAGLAAPVTVWGPAALAVYWDGFLASVAMDIDLRIEDEGRPDLRDFVTLKTISPEAPFEIGPLVVDAIRNVHPPLTDSYAMRFSGAGKRVVFSADTAPFPELVEFTRGADLLVHEAMLGDALLALVARVGNGDDRLMTHLKRSHTLAADAARVATEAEVRALAFHHLIPSDDPAYTEEHWLAEVRPHWSGPFHLGWDGLRIVL